MPILKDPVCNIQNSWDAIIIHDLRGKLLTWNRGAELMYGYTETQALKMDISKKGQ